jgi:hypothetical protein
MMILIIMVWNMNDHSVWPRVFVYLIYVEIEKCSIRTMRLIYRIPFLTQTFFLSPGPKVPT